MTGIEIALLLLAILGVVVGIAGTVIPFLPGIPLVFISVAAYAALTRFAYISVQTVIILGLITLASFVLDAFVVASSIRRAGGTRLGMWAAAAGALLGLIVASLPGMLIGAVVGLIVGELYAGRAPETVPRSLVGVLSGIVVSTILRFALAIAMATGALVALIV